MKGTALNALRKVKNQTAAAAEEVRRIAAGEESRSAVRRKTGSQIVSARPTSFTHLASIRPVSAGIEGATGAGAVRAASPPASCMRTPKKTSFPGFIYPRRPAVSP